MYRKIKNKERKERNKEGKRKIEKERNKAGMKNKKMFKKLRRKREKR